MRHAETTGDVCVTPAGCVWLRLAASDLTTTLDASKQHLDACG
ncbi:hypothetical protein C368_02323 [Cryptococcus neoformans 125.91]|nr:hypothetical protein C368_02323 [Cryptococcus neoformans var. grubii 125.91]